MYYYILSIPSIFHVSAINHSNDGYKNVGDILNNRRTKDNTLLFAVVSGLYLLFTMMLIVSNVTAKDSMHTREIPSHVQYNEDIYSTISNDKVTDIRVIVQKDNAPYSVGDKVLLSNETEDTIVELLPTGFTLNNAERNITAGMSGSPVICDGITIGLVQGMYSDGTVFCTWYK